MEWYYAEQGQQKGPVSESDLHELVRLGRIDDKTLVWCQTMKEWQPYGIAGSTGAAGASTDTPAATAAAHRCGECGRTFSENDMVHLGNAWICATCKPRFLQRLQEGATVAASAGWRSGKDLIVPVEATLPDRCVKCNVPVQEDGRMTRKLYWHHPLVYLLLLINLLVFIIVALVVRKRATVTLSLCRKHRAARIRHITIAWALVLAGFALFFGGVSLSTGDQTLAWAGAGIALLLGGAIYGAALGRILVPHRIDRDTARLRGACPAFLDAFPDWAKESR